MFPALLIGVVIGLPIAAAILRWGCRMAGVDPPDFGRALGIVFIVTIACTAVNIFVGILLGAPLHERRQLAPDHQFVVAIITLIVNMFVAALCYSRFLPDVTLGRAAMIYWAQMLILFGVVVAVAGVFMALSTLAR